MNFNVCLNREISRTLNLITANRHKWDTTVIQSTLFSLKEVIPKPYYTSWVEHIGGQAFTEFNFSPEAVFALMASLSGFDKVHFRIEHKDSNLTEQTCMDWLAYFIFQQIKSAHGDMRSFKPVNIKISSLLCIGELITASTSKTDRQLKDNHRLIDVPIKHDVASVLVSNGLDYIDYYLDRLSNDALWFHMSQQLPHVLAALIPILSSKLRARVYRLLPNELIEAIPEIMAVAGYVGPTDLLIDGFLCSTIAANDMEPLAEIKRLHQITAA